MTETEVNFLEIKRHELAKCYAWYGEEKVNEWDLPKFMAIIADLERENRKLKTALSAKEKRNI